MVPRWFWALVAVQIAGVIALSVVGVRMLSGGIRAAAGEVMHWAHSTPAAPPSWPAVVVLPTPAPQLRSSTGGIGPDLLQRLNRDTATTATGEYSLLLRLESAIGEQVLQLLTNAARGH